MYNLKEKCITDVTFQRVLLLLLVLNYVTADTSFNYVCVVKSLKTIVLLSLLVFTL